MIASASTKTSFLEVRSGNASSTSHCSSRAIQTLKRKNFGTHHLQCLSEFRSHGLWERLKDSVSKTARRILQSSATGSNQRQKQIFCMSLPMGESPQTDKVISGKDSKGFPEAEGKGPTLTVTILSSIKDIAAQEWDACAIASTGEESLNPFLLHGFFCALEESKSACAATGWLPQHLVARDDNNKILGVVPLYLKGHSYGEYVFDHAWASAYSRSGQSYYPKLQSCVPFTPATGPRILVKEGSWKEDVFEGLCSAMKQMAVQFRVSSVHVTFPTGSEWDKMSRVGYLRRTGMQYHWENRGYKTFEDFLGDLKAGRRKNIRQERKKVAAQGLVLKRLRGSEIKPYHWDAFYAFYLNTTDSKWGQAYLTREFFHMLGENLSDKVLLVVAELEGRVVAGALNLVGGDTLFGRNWGCQPRTDFPFLHFEACYYQAIEAAIEMGLSRVEAGAQGEHKIQRGYLPSQTYSNHFIPDVDFSAAVQSFLRREAYEMDMAMEQLARLASPFKDGIDTRES